MQHNDAGDEDKRMASLHHGPRMRSQATVDFEIVLHEFMSKKPTKYQINRLGEVEIEIGNKIYNLSKIIEHKPDFEHINFGGFNAEQEAEAQTIFREMTTWRVELDKTVRKRDRKNMVIYEVELCDKKAAFPGKGKLLIASTPKGLICKLHSPEINRLIPWSTLPEDIPTKCKNIQDIMPYLTHITKALSHVDTSEISETEARAIRYYSMESNNNNAFLKINQFVRENGKINDINNPDTVDLRTMMFVYAYYTKAIMSLRSNRKLAEMALGIKESKDQEVFRGEKYETPRFAQTVRDKRTLQNLTLEGGFFSSSLSLDNSKIFTHEVKKLNNQNIQITVKQKEHSYGADTSRYSELKNEQEVSFLAFSQFIFYPSPTDKNSLIAVPVKSIDEIYHHHYRHDLIDSRTQLLRMIDDYSKEPHANPVLIKLIENFCLAIFNHGSTEMSLSWNACKNCLTSLEIMPKIPAIALPVGACIAQINNMKMQLEAFVQQDLNRLHELLIKAGDYVYGKHLKKAYTQPHVSNLDLNLTLNDVIIERPNHGLAHVMRKAMYIPVIYNIFRLHAKDDKFRKALDCITADQLKLIQIAILFSVSGRESELGAIDSKENYEVYLSYRNAAKSNFIAYVMEAGLIHKKQQGVLLTDEHDEINAFIKTLTQQIERFGDPQFLKEVIGDRRPERACLYNMLNLAHNLDLLRCYTVDEIGPTLTKMKAALTTCYLDDSFPEHGMPVLLKMANDCLTATGDRQFVAWQRDKLVEVDKHYSEAFVGCSISATTALRTCFLATPVFEEMANDKLNDAFPRGLTPVQTKLLTFNRFAMADIVHDVNLNRLQIIIMGIIEVNRIVVIHADTWKDLRDCIENDETLDSIDLAVALHIALQHDQTNIASLAIKKGADLTVPNRLGETPLFTACSKKMHDIILEIVLQPNSGINQPADNNITPINRAIDNLQWNVIEVLIKSTEIDLSEETGSRLVSTAIMHSKFDLVDDILALQPQIDLNYPTTIKLPLVCAVESAEVSLVIKLLQHGASINYASPGSDNSLRLAVTMSSWNLVYLFAEDPSVDVNCCQHRGDSLMHYAVELRDQTLFNILMNRQARVDIVNEISLSAIELAIEYKSQFTKQMITSMMTSTTPPSRDMISRIMRRLLESPYENLFQYAFDEIYVKAKRPLNECDAKGKTLLHHACETLSLKLVTDLLIMKYYSDFRGTGPHSPLYCAAASNSVELVSLLIEHGATIDALPVNNGAASVKSSPILCAAYNRHWDMVDALMKAPGASLHIYDIDGNSPLSWACKDGSKKTVGSLIQQGASVNQPSDINGEHSPLRMAVQSSNWYPVIDTLLQAGVDINAKPSAIYLAARLGFWTVVKYLLTRPEVRVAEISHDGDTILHLACKAAQIEVVEKLSHAQSSQLPDVNQLSNLGETALSIAVFNNDEQLVTLLLKNRPYVAREIIESLAKSHYWKMLTLLLNAKDFHPEAIEPVFAVNKVFFEAVGGRNIELALQLMQRPDFAMNFVNSLGVTALRDAISIGNRELITGILQHKSISVEINSCADVGRTAAIVAVLKEDWETLTMIIHHPSFDPSNFAATQRLLVILLDEHRKEDLVIKILELVPKEQKAKHCELLYCKQQPSLQLDHTTMFAQQPSGADQADKQHAPKRPDKLV